ALLSLLQGKGEDNYGLHLILFSEDGLVERIDALQIIDVPVYDFTMPAMSPSELHDFLLQHTPLEDIKKNKLQQIWSSTKGNPGQALKIFLSEKKMPDNNQNAQTQGFTLPLGHLVAIVVLLGI